MLPQAGVENSNIPVPIEIIAFLWITAQNSSFGPILNDESSILLKPQERVAREVGGAFLYSDTITRISIVSRTARIP